MKPFLILLFLFTFGANNFLQTNGQDDEGIYKIGTGIGDITGPPAGVVLNGYVNPITLGAGIFTRQFARTFIVESLTTGNVVVYVTVDLGMMDHSVKMEVIKKLQPIYGDKFSMKNLMISATHTHSGPSGYMTNFAYLVIESYQFNPISFWAIVLGIFESIDTAAKSSTSGRIFFNKGEIIGLNGNRRSNAYDNNPESERQKYKYDVDKDMTILKFEALENNDPIGVFTWWPVHPISFNGAFNPLVSSDNKGYAAVLFDNIMNPGKRPGTGKFVSGFGSSNLGDVTARYNGREFKEHQLKGVNFTQPIEDTKHVGSRQFEKAYELFNDKGTLKQLKGPVKFAHRFIDSETIEVKVTDSDTGEEESLKLCKAALGYSYVGLDPIYHELWDFIRDLIKEPTDEMISCQAPKLIALPAGEMKEPWEWAPSIMALQLLQIGNFDIAGSPGEYTTMSGRRVRNAIFNVTGNEGVVAGLANSYINYIATPEEYDVTEMEGGATIYGRNTLPVTIALFEEMAYALIYGDEITSGPTPPTYLDQLNTEIAPRVDIPFLGRLFGSVVYQPKETYVIGDEVTVIFASASPRHSSLRKGSFFLIERQNSEVNRGWEVVRTDADLDTTFWWKQLVNEGEIKWRTGDFDVQPGTYRIRHFGYHLKRIGDQPRAYSGTSNTFQMLSS